MSPYYVDKELAVELNTDEAIQFATVIAGNVIGADQSPCASWTGRSGSYVELGRVGIVCESWMNASTLIGIVEAGVPTVNATRILDSKFRITGKHTR